MMRFFTPVARRWVTWLGLSLFLSSAALPQPTYWTSRDGLYRVTYDSDLDPIVINRMHRWRLRLEDASGNPVSGAQLNVRGGMPIHDHGLPTEPRVTQELAAGEYLLEGVRFHMAGSWEIELRIVASAGSDTITIPLEL